MIERKLYLEKLINSEFNGLVKIITGIRRCGKSVLLFDIYYDYLIKKGINPKNIITIKLDKRNYIKYRNPEILCDFVKNAVSKKDKKYYIFIDEIQLIEPLEVEGIKSKIGIYEVLNELNDYKNLDVYVTGSNSKMLSSDILTEFRGRGYEIRIHPLSFSEFIKAYDGDKKDAFNHYLKFGGMPKLFSFKDNTEKIDHLKKEIEKVYIADIIERNGLRKDEAILGKVLDVIASSVGSLTSVFSLSNSFKSKIKQYISPNTISTYLRDFEDAFLIKKTSRYDIRGKQYIDSPSKYYFEDVGMRNARIGFKEIDITHLMENVIYNELIIRGFDVDIGVIEYYIKNKDNKTQRVNLEIDFICNKGNEKYYIQSAYGIPDKEKLNQETRGFSIINDSYQKIVILRDNIIKYKDDNGILYVGIEEFLLDQKIV